VLEQQMPEGLAGELGDCPLLVVLPQAQAEGRLGVESESVALPLITARLLVLLRVLSPICIRSAQVVARAEAMERKKAEMAVQAAAP